MVRPRVFWDGGNGRTFFATAGFTAENRQGGGRPDGVPYVEALDTRHADAGAVGQLLIRQRYLVSMRGAVMRQRHDHLFGDVRERDRHETMFGEVTIRAAARRHTLVAGAALERDAYRPQDLPRFAYTFTVPGVFAQDDVDLTQWLSLSMSGRVDHHSTYGTFVSPRVSALVRRGSWTSRVSLGTGFFGPSPLTEETEAAGLTRLMIPRPLRAEDGRSTSLDLSRTDGPLSYTLTLFGFASDSDPSPRTAGRGGLVRRRGSARGKHDLRPALTATASIHTLVASTRNRPGAGMWIARVTLARSTRRVGLRSCLQLVADRAPRTRHRPSPPRPAAAGYVSYPSARIGRAVALRRSVANARDRRQQ